MDTSTCCGSHTCFLLAPTNQGNFRQLEGGTVRAQVAGMRIRSWGAGGVLWLVAAFGSFGTAHAEPANAEPSSAPAAPRIEVAFALDATGSMGPYINEARERIRAIAAELASGTPKPDVRFGLVTFRDRGDAYVTRVHPFSRDIEQMYKALEATQADGGGDHPEAVYEGVQDALTKLTWSPVTDEQVIRLVYVVGDAPPQSYAGGPTDKSLTAAARKKHIVIHGIMCSGELAEFDALARHTEGRSYELRSSSRVMVAGSRDSGLAGALTAATKDYSTSIGVSFSGKGSAPVPTAPLATPDVVTTGLIGAHARWVNDATAWSDLWSVHTSLTATAARPPVPAVDFTKHTVLVLGGSAGGLDLEGVVSERGRRAVRVKPQTTPSVKFVLVSKSSVDAKERAL
jgi:hypothetical protein